MPFPFQPLVLDGAEPVDVFLRAVAQPDLRTLDGSDHAGGEVHGAAKYVAFLNVYRPDVNAGADAHLRMAGWRRKAIA